MSFEQTNGSRAQVWHGTAKHTSGGLTKSALMKNKHGRIVSRRKHTTAKKENRLVKAGYITKKGHFGFIKTGKGTKKNKSKRKGHKGGAYALSPSPYNGQGVGTSGVGLQFVAGNGN
jgi:3-deoxy-D-arabino-heptulosonate 7-phosphate (DAHP) synthase